MGTAEKIVTSLGLSMAIAEYHKPDETEFYWVGNKVIPSGRIDYHVEHKSYCEHRKEKIPAYTAQELMYYLVPGRIDAAEIQRAYPIPTITAAADEEWDEQYERRNEAIEKLSDYIRDWDQYNGWELRDVFDNADDKWHYDLILDIRPGVHVLYYADDSDAEYWQIAAEFTVKEKDDQNLANLLAKMALHNLRHKVVLGDNGQGVLSV